MKKLTALLVAALFALGLSFYAFAGEVKKDEPAAKEATTMKKDCLLYTSPSPRD